MPDRPPSEFDSESDWTSYCVPFMTGEGMEQDQAVASCLQMWRDRNKSGAERLTKSYNTMNRAYSRLEIKTIDDEQRILKGIASTPAVDRVGDIVVPTGASFVVPMPLMLDHNHEEQVGHVFFAKPTKAGIPFEARIVKFDEPGEVKDLVDKAWHLVKTKLRSFVSIGFKPLAEGIELMEDGGLKFNRWEWLETSLVSIPANREAVILEAKSLDAAIREIKSLDQGIPAAMGNTDALAPRPGASGKSKAVTLKMERKMSVSAPEQVAALEAKLAAHQSRCTEIMSKAAGESRSTDEADRVEFDDLQGEIEVLKGDLVRWRRVEEFNKSSAQPIGQPKTLEEGSQTRGNGTGASYLRVREPQLPPGVSFARMVQCIGRAHGNYFVASKIAEEAFPDHPSISLYLKATVPAATTTDSTWAGALVSAEGAPFADFLEFYRAKTILGRFGNGGVPSLRNVPFRVPLGSQTSGMSGYWVGEGQAKGLTRADFARTTLEPRKVANICAVSQELIMFSGINIETALRDELVRGLVATTDTGFIDPNSSATQFKPASVTNGVSVITSAGSSADNVRSDILAVWSLFDAANNPAESAVWIMSPSTARAVSLMTNAFGQAEDFARGITPTGGTFAGSPVIVSNYVGESGSPTGRFVWLVNANDIWLGEEGGFQVKMSTEASLLMDDAPNMASGGIGSPETSGGAAGLVSMFQTNSIAFLAERFINWAKARAQAVQGIASVQWGI